MSSLQNLEDKFAVYRNSAEAYNRCIKGVDYYVHDYRFAIKKYTYKCRFEKNDMDLAAIDYDKAKLDCKLQHAK